MEKSPYRVGEGANLKVLPRGTRVGDVVHLTEAEALYERDMGRLTAVTGKAAPAPPDDAEKVAPADGIGKMPVAGDTLTVEAEDGALAGKRRR